MPTKIEKLINIYIAHKTTYTRTFKWDTRLCIWQWGIVHHRVLDDVSERYGRCHCPERSAATQTEYSHLTDTALAHESYLRCSCHHSWRQ